ncbi:hypothetical protein F5890DRAFT_284637 [Lentinula detonsa]|uniref:Uncharacterized protein n=1 Tax=Lentinula detonsa TaxID=2804962 RepID=A0AA38PMH3_9AGAR|nr:hypothetical protein F5890DRAFT_284637 [Lentinula detonsa]
MFIYQSCLFKIGVYLQVIVIVSYVYLPVIFIQEWCLFTYCFYSRSVFMYQSCLFTTCCDSVWCLITYQCFFMFNLLCMN